MVDYAAHQYLGLLVGEPGPEEILAAAIVGGAALQLAAAKLFTCGKSVEDVQRLYDQACELEDSVWVGSRAAAIIIGTAPDAVWWYARTNRVRARRHETGGGGQGYIWQYHLPALVALRKERET